MPKLTIDDFEIEVPRGTKVINAADRLGIIIPRFCYHPALGSVGACRICAVSFLDGPVKGVQMSCMIDAQDGMVVSTRDEEAVDFRKHVIEWLMTHHPHDCPVCDEGGECLLQDMTVSSGHGIRRFPGKKWIYRDQFLGPFVQHEMNRCIHCWRCRRFYQEFTGYRDLGVKQIAYRTYFGRFTDGPLESPFAGNLNDLCPTGVYTDKPSRYRGRRWDFKRSPSVCIHCSLGCNVVANAHYREIVRIEARLNDDVNGYFICDRGRYGFQYESHPERPRHARVDGKEVLPDEAVRIAGERFSGMNGGIASLGSLRSSVESQAMLKRLCHVRGWTEPAFFTEDRTARNVKTAVSCLDERLAVSLREIERADFILAVGADPLNEAPMLALAMRQASRGGAAIVVIDPRPVSLPFPFTHFPVAPGGMDRFFAALIKGTVDRTSAEKLGPDAIRFHDAMARKTPFDDLFKELFSELKEKIGKSRFTVVICGTDIVPETTPRLAADAALWLFSSKEKVGLFYLMPGPNAFSAGLLIHENGSLPGILTGIESGTTKALLVVENDPFWDFPDRERLERAIRKIDLLIVIDHLPSKIARLAHVFIPSSTLFETETGFINQEGRIQFTQPIHPGGIPLHQISDGGHPPRVFRSDIPGSGPRPAYEILDGISAAMAGERKEGSREDLWEWLSRENPTFAVVREGDFSSGSKRLPLKQGDRPFSTDWSSQKYRQPGDSLHLLLVDWTFGTEELSSYSKYSHPAEKTPSLLMHPKDAERLNLRHEERVVLSFDAGPLEVDLRTESKMAPGTAILPRHRQLHWQRIKGITTELPLDRIKKA